MWMWQETLLQSFVKLEVNKTLFAPWLSWQRPPFWICSTLKSSPHNSGYSYTVSWSLMKGIQNYFKSPLFRFHGNCGKICPTNSKLFGLSRFTGCGCCSYQVSSISVLRITCYEYFCVFHGNFIFNFINTSKDSTHYGEYSYDVSWSLMKEIKNY